MIRNQLLRLERIARKNEDYFTYIVHLGLYKSGSIQYNFQAIETAEGHIFVNGTASTLELAIERAMEYIPDALKHWGYSE